MAMSIIVLDFDSSYAVRKAKHILGNSEELSLFLSR